MSEHFIDVKKDNSILSSINKLLDFVYSDSISLIETDIKHQIKNDEASKLFRRLGKTLESKKAY